jgi:hypothetical protein
LVTDWTLPIAAFREPRFTLTVLPLRCMPVPVPVVVVLNAVPEESATTTL